MRILNTVEQGSHRKALWVFTPSLTDPKDLEFILVQRQKLLQDAVERVRESALTDNKHYLLFVAPRGCGKTHLVTLIVNRISLDEGASNCLRIAWLNEDETCTTLLELLLKIHAALEKRYPADYNDGMLHAAYEMEADVALEFVSKHLLDSLGSRTLLVIIENLDALFEGLGDGGQKQLRAFIQENPKISIVATAQRLVENLSSRTSPFFGFFQTEHLKPLRVEDATALLKNIARLHKQDNVVEYLSTSYGRSRVRALHHLSGGNHRVYIVLSQFITRDSIDALLGPFMKMVDELTPYYQERIRWLPPMQRKIVEYLCGCETTVPVKVIAKRLFATSQTISSQLQDLREKGYVESSQRGRESLYEISEPLMRICVEVKENQRYQPLRLLVDFLRVWYDDQELIHRLGNFEPTTIARTYFESAIERNKVDGNLRKLLILDDLRQALSETMNLTQQEDWIQKCGNLPETILLAMNNIVEGRNVEATDDLAKAIGEESDPVIKATALFSRAKLYDSMKETGKAIEDYTAFIKLPDAPMSKVVVALLSRGIAYGEAGEIEHAIEDFTTLIEFPNAPVTQVAVALFLRGKAYVELNKIMRGIEDYTTVVGIPNAPIKLVASALVCRGITYHKIGDKQDAVKDFTTITSLGNVPISGVVNAYQALTEIYWSEGRWSDGFEALQAGLNRGAEEKPPYFGATEDLIGAIFSVGLNLESRLAKVSELLDLYGRYQALSVLGEGLIKHIGSVFRSGKLFKPADNLDQWALAWEQASVSLDEFKLPLRLLKTGINFIKTGGKDTGALLDLTFTERQILHQAFGLTE